MQRRVGIIYCLDFSPFKFLYSRFLCLLAAIHVQEEEKDIDLKPGQLLFVFSIPFIPLLLYLCAAGELGSIGVCVIEGVQFFAVNVEEYKVNIRYSFVGKMPIMLVGEAVKGGGKFVGGGHLCSEGIIGIYLNQFLFSVIIVNEVRTDADCFSCFYYLFILWIDGDGYSGRVSIFGQPLEGGGEYE